MKSYLIPLLTESQVKVLQEAAVTFYVFDQTRQSYIIVGDHLSRALDLLNCNAEESPSQFENVVQLTLTTRPPKVEEFVPADAQGRIKSRQMYIQACSSRLAVLIEAARASLRKTMAALTAPQEQLLGLLRLDNFAGKTVTREEYRLQFAAEFDRLKQVRGVKNVTVAGNQILLNTEILCAQHPQSGQIREIGKFLIVINLQGGKSPVRWFNGTRRIDGLRAAMNAPGVYADGTPMLDEIQETMLELTARLELSIVAELAIQFIETVSCVCPDSHLAKWPLAQSSF